jgi:hypothetical protein
MQFSTQQRGNAFGGNRNEYAWNTGDGKDYAMKKTGKISPPVGA